MYFNNWMSIFIVGAASMMAIKAGTVPPTTQLIHEGGVDLYKPGHKKDSCTEHNQCSCTGGIPICHEGVCNCIMTHFVCFENKHCGDLCEGGIGACFANACKCYRLVEDTQLTDSVSPWPKQLPL